MKIFMYKFILHTLLLLFINHGAAAGTIDLGVVLPLSSILSQAGHTNLQGHELAVEHINELGGSHGKMYRLKVADSQGDVLIGARETRKLISAGAVAILGTYQSAVTLSSSEIADAHNVPFIITTALSDQLTTRGLKYVFRTEPSQSGFVRAQFSFLEENGFNEGTSVALIYERTLWGRTTAQIQRKWANNKKYNIVHDIDYAFGKGQFATQAESIASRLKDAPVEVVLLCSYLQESMDLARSFSSIGVNPEIVIGTGAGSKDPMFAKKLGPIAENWAVINEWSPDMLREGVQELNTQYRAKYGEDMNGIAAVSYVATWIVKEAIDKSRCSTGSCLRDSIASLDVRSGPATILPIGRIEFDKDGNNVSTPIVTQVQKGVQRTIWPSSLSTAKLIKAQYHRGAACD